ncbi:MAG: hypothetical protein WBD36_10485 [Bacteroidota bacterium]
MQAISESEKVVISLLRPPALGYVRELRRSLDKDPEYLMFHSLSVGLNIRRYLADLGIHWEDEIFQREWQEVVRKAVIYLRTIEK